MRTLREVSLQILKNSGCDEKTYEGVGVDVIEADLREAFPNGIEGGFPYKDVADDIYALSTAERGWKPKIKYEHDGEYASQWGLTDLYEDIEKKLRTLVDGKQPFETCSLDSHKEICGWSMQRHLEGGPITISVWAAMDEGSALVSDALPSGVPEDVFTEEQYDEIVEEYEGDGEFGYEERVEADVPGDYSLDDILKKVSELGDEADKTLKEWFEGMKELVRLHLPAEYKSE